MSFLEQVDVVFLNTPWLKSLGLGIAIALALILFAVTVSMAFRTDRAVWTGNRGLDLVRVVVIGGAGSLFILVVFPTGLWAIFTDWFGAHSVWTCYSTAPTAYTVGVFAWFVWIIVLMWTVGAVKNALPMLEKVGGLSLALVSFGLAYATPLRSVAEYCAYT